MTEERFSAMLLAKGNASRLSEIITWCRKNCPSYMFNTITLGPNFEDHLIFFFGLETDVVLFNLKWL